MSTGLHVRRATELTGAEREEIFTRTESVARWSRERRAAYEAERRSAVRFAYFTGARCSNQPETYYIRGDGGFFLKLPFIFSSVFLRCCAVRGFLL